MYTTNSCSISTFSLFILHRRMHAMILHNHTKNEHLNNVPTEHPAESAKHRTIDAVQFTLLSQSSSHAGSGLQAELIPSFDCVLVGHQPTCVLRLLRHNYCTEHFSKLLWKLRMNFISQNSAVTLPFYINPKSDWSYCNTKENMLK